jgi:MYXO-CTERM domain-containing protein
MRQLLALTLLLLPKVAQAQDSLDPSVENDLTLTPVVQGLSGPTGFEFIPDGRMLIIQQTGETFLWDGQNLNPSGNVPLGDSGGERGLLGLAIDPMFATTNRIYFYYSNVNFQEVGWTTLDTGTGQLDVANVTVIIDHLSADRNHDGGALKFGPDGNLYIGVGDTGCNCGCPPGTNTNNYFPTCMTKYNGKILRIDRDGNAPADNPLVGVTEAPACGGTIDNNNCTVADDFPTATADPLDEIFAWGFRNPWRFAFDSATGYLWIGDVGETTWEEITILRSGGEHHGWPFREGAEGQTADTCLNVVPQSTGNCVDPAFAYNHDEAPAAGNGSVTGGVFSDHCSWPAPWNGLYWFSDYNKARVWTLTPNGNRDGIEMDSRAVIVRAANGTVHMATGPDGAIYYATINDGEIWRIAPANPANCGTADGGVNDDATPIGDDAMEPIDGMQPMDGNVQMDAAANDLGSKDASDSGTIADTGTGGGDDGKCKCTSTHAGNSGAWWLLLALGISFLRARRDRRSPADR